MDGMTRKLAAYIGVAVFCTLIVSFAVACTGAVVEPVPRDRGGQQQPKGQDTK